MKEQQETSTQKWYQITADDRLLLSTSRTATVMGVSTKTLGEWERAGCPKEKRGWYDVAAVAKWKREQRAPAVSGSREARKTEADIRYKAAKAAIAEQDLKLRTGKLIEVSVVEEGLESIFQNLKVSMMAIADHIMMETYTQFPELAPQIRRLIDGYVRAALNDAARNRGQLTEQRDAGKSGGNKKKTRGRPRKHNK